MPALSEEVRHVQNPALCAMLEWRFVVGYRDSREDAGGCPLPLLFLVLPVVLHRDTLQYVESTQRRTGLRAFAAKFATVANNESDVLLTLHDRATALRDLSLESLRMAIGARLLTVDTEAGVAYELTKTPRAWLAERVRELARNAEKLGHWCGALTLLEVSSILRVRF